MKLSRVSDKSPAVRRRGLKSFWKSRDGSVMPIIALSTMALVGAIGMAVDGSRLMMMHSSLQRAADAGGLSAVAKLDVDTLESEVQKFTTANFSSGYVGANINTLTATLSEDATTLTVNARATANTTFMRVLGIKTMSTSVESVINRSVRGLELVLVMDNTGSMAGTYLTSLKSAAKSMLDVLYGKKETVENLYVGLVPFSQAVNIGKSRTDWLASGSIAALNYPGSTSWGGCVEARGDGRDTTDDTPGTQSFRPYYWKDYSSDTSDKNDTKNNNWITKKDGKWKYSNTADLGPNKNCPVEVTPMTTKKSELVTAIDAMTAVGNTHVNLGAVWGWRMLSPKWRGKWGGAMNSNDPQLPLDYGTEGMSKAAVIMTDGENTMSSTVYTAYGWLSDNKLGVTATKNTTLEKAAVAELNKRLTNTCTEMKNKGIVVYTIAFRIKPGEPIEDLLKDCASKDAYYFNPPTAADLKKAFVMIGGSLSDLRVSK